MGERVGERVGEIGWLGRNPKEVLLGNALQAFASARNALLKRFLYYFWPNLEDHV